MGHDISVPVTSVVVRRAGGASFRVGFAEMAGWRPTMEDAHAILIQENWAFFGIFDGHGGDQCSKFIARRFLEELGKGVPSGVDDMKAMALRLDADFLATKQDSGSTGTFVLVHAPSEPLGKYVLHVGNVGDSRVLLCHSDGTMVEGPGTDGALTCDHKPDHPSERERIEKAGCRVDCKSAVARVNGDLAVSRAFGDARFKCNDAIPPEQQAVCASPEMATFECNHTDILILVCDGISEGAFPNRDVARLAAGCLRRGSAVRLGAGDLRRGDAADLGQAAAAACRRALKSGSKDNLSCMVISFDGGHVSGASVELLPGPIDVRAGDGFFERYGAMAARADLSLAESVCLRYDCLKDDIFEAQFEADDSDGASDINDVSMNGLSSELADFGEGPPPSLARGSADRVRWFENWLKQFRTMGASMDTTTDFLINAELEALSKVRVAALADVQTAMEAHTALEWDSSLEDACGQEGYLIMEDPKDGTSQVRISSDFMVWLPTCVLTRVSG